MTAYIVEDEQLALGRMKILIERSHHKIDIVGASHTGRQAVQEINALKPELIFLDIHLLDMTGFELLKHIVYQPYIIFTTAYNEYAVDAFNHITVDYLLKPVTQEKLDKAFMKLLTIKDKNLSPERLSEPTKEKIHQIKKKRTSFTIKKNDKMILIDVDDVAWCKAEDKYVEIGEKNGKSHLLSKSLSQLEEELPDNYIRIHRSYIINADYVLEIHKHFKGRYVFKLSDHIQSSITSSESYLGVIKERFEL